MAPRIILLLTFATTLVCLSKAHTVIVGEMFGPNSPTRLIYQKLVELDGYPLIKRVKEEYYEYPNQGLQIKGIAIRDLKNSQAEASITRGGLGYSFVNIKLKSERGSGLKYSIEIYA